MTPHSILFTLAAIGISETKYLINKRYAAERPVCPIGEDCSVVLSSKYSTVLGVHNDIVGFLAYVAIAVVAAMLVIGVGPSQWLELFVRAFVAGGAVFSLFLIYIQWRVLKAWCFWCVMSALTLFGMFAVVLTQSLII